MLIDKPGIARLIPHAGAMCLLDGILNWDDARIQCATTSHRALDNPLRRDGRLGVLCGVEYAAQAMAAHSVLGAGQTGGSGQPRTGALASLRAVVCHIDRLDLQTGTLIVEAERLYGETDRAIYRFTLRQEDRILLEGRATAVLGGNRGLKRALVTGGSGTVGQAIAWRLAVAGHHVIIHAHHGMEAAQSVAAKIRELGGFSDVSQFDIVDPEATGVALKRLLEDGPIQILVNNAGIHDDAVLPGMARDQWLRVLDVSLNGFFNVTQPLLLPMIRTRWGRIVSVSSVSAILGNRGQVNYAAAKAGLHGATRSLALELASRGITVNAVAPGIIESPMTATAFPPDMIDRLVPMKRAGRPEEVAELIEFLASDRASYVSGQVISINGGMI